MASSTLAFRPDGTLATAGPLRDPGDRVAVIGAGNADDLPLRPLRRRADLIDLDAAALRRAQRRLGTRRRALGMVVEDVTFGRADAITRATVNGHAPPPTAPTPRHLADPYDVVIADLLFTQLLYPALTDGGLPGPVIDSTMRRHGQPLTDAVVACAARQRTRGPGHARPRPPRLVARPHPQPFAVDDVLTLAEHDLDAALELAQTGDVPYGCDPRGACLALGANIIDTTLWRWPFAPGVDYLVCATVARPGQLTDMAPTREPQA